MSTNLKIPKDLIEFANSSFTITNLLYDLNLLPEQIDTKEGICSLRGIKIGFEYAEKIYTSK